MVPDLDVIAFTLGIPYAHPLGHRGFLHSLLFALLLGACAPLFVAGGPKSNRRLVLAVTTIGIVVVSSHGTCPTPADRRFLM